MAREYVELRDGGYWIAGTRVSLDSMVYEFRKGASPESLARSFPVLTLEEVYGGLAFYLGHQREVDTVLAHSEGEFSALQKDAANAAPGIKAKLREAREARANDR